MEFAGIVGSALWIVILLLHMIAWISKPIEYNSFKYRRDAFEQTLLNARLNNNPYEIAAIVKDIASWNENLAERKYNNTIPILKYYVDDRIELLEPIK